MRSVICLFLYLLLTACSSIRYLDIETYNPGEVTFPDHITDVLIVNNAVAQPSDAVKYTVQSVDQDTFKVSADSALYYACHTLGKSIVDEHYFNDVLLYNTPLRTDEKFLIDQKLTNRQVKELCEEAGVNAIISLDRLLFKMDKQVQALSDGVIHGYIKVDISGVIRAYLPERENPLATVQFADSVFWSEYMENLNLLPWVLPSPEEALNVAGKYMGEKVYTNFVPYWENEVRWYYIHFGAKWKEAAAYAQTEKWDLAAKQWEAIYNNSGKWQSKAKSASNIALSYEIKGDLEKAYEWAKISSELFDANTKEDNGHRKMTSIYFEALGNRLYLTNKLDKQIGIE